MPIISPAAFMPRFTATFNRVEPMPPLREDAVRFGHGHPHPHPDMKEAAFHREYSRKRKKLKKQGIDRKSFVAAKMAVLLERAKGNSLRK